MKEKLFGVLCICMCGIWLVGCSGGIEGDKSDFIRGEAPVYDSEFITIGLIQTGKESDWRDANTNDYLDIFVAWYRDVLLFKATKDIDRLIFKEEISALRIVAGRCSYEGIETVIKALDKAKTRLNANVNFELAMELLLMTIKECG